MLEEGDGMEAELREKEREKVERGGGERGEGRGYGKQEINYTAKICLKRHPGIKSELF